MAGSQNRWILDVEKIQELIVVHLDMEEQEKASLISRGFYGAICRFVKNKKLKLTAKVSPLFIRCLLRVSIHQLFADNHERRQLQLNHEHKPTV